MGNFRYKEIAEIIGVLAIVASLIFVGLQIKQSHEIAMASTYQARSQASQNLKVAALESPELISAMTKILGGKLDEITQSEFVTLDYSIAAEMSGFENLHYQYQLGFLPEEHWQKNRRDLHCWLSLPIYRDIVKYYNYRDSFQKILDAMISEATQSPERLLDISTSTFRRLR